MTDAMTFVVAGLTVGSALGLVAVGIVLTYRTSGILNFAQGAFAIVAVDTYIYLTVNRGYSWEVAALISVFGVGTVMGLLLEPLARVLGRAPVTLQVVATVGLLIAIQSGSILIGPHLPGSNPHFVVPPMPFESIQIAGVYVGKDQMIIAAVGLVCALGLYAFLRVARIGVAMRAIVTNPELLELTGTSAVSVRRWAWVVGSTFAALSGVLLALSPTFGPSPASVSLLIVPAFAAAAIATFSSLPLAYVGGLVVGVAGSLLTRYGPQSWLPGLAPAAPFVILIVVLLVTPRRRLEPYGEVVPGRRIRDLRLPTAVNVGLGAAALVFLALVPTWVGFDIGLYTTGLVYVVLFLSLGLMMKTGGMVSLCQIAFAAVGATTFARCTSHLGIPWVPSFVLAALVAGIVGAFVALAAVRLTGVFVALSTLAFGYALQQLAYTTSLMFNTAYNNPLIATRPSFASSDTGYYYLVVVAVVACVAIVFALDRSRLGRLLRGVADSEPALSVQGASTSITKLVVFAISAAIAGAAGALLAGAQFFVTPSAYSPATSLTLVALVFVVRLGLPWYAAAAALAYYVLPLKIDVEQAGTWVQLVVGVLAVVTAVLTVVARRDRRRTKGRVADGGAPELRVTAAAPLTAPPGTERPETELPETGLPETELTDRAGTPGVDATRGLEVDGVTVRFGGLVALDRVDLVAPKGAITGLIGPNGAGKSTLFNVCSGMVAPASGGVRLGGHDITALGVAGRARRGLGRTFQRPALFESLTVRDAVALGHEAARAGANPWRHVVAQPMTAADRTMIDEALALSGVLPFADAVIAELSTGERRLAEIARCLSGQFDLLLLDEPTAGLDRAESRRFAATLRDIVAARGVGILVVEHDMSVIMDVCERVTVLDFGVVLFEGTPAEAVASDEVRAAYLGSELVEPIGSDG